LPASIGPKRIPGNRTEQQKHRKRTLHDAGHYAAALPLALQEQVAWQTAAEMLMQHRRDHAG